jgi:hypothetical protein
MFFFVHGLDSFEKVYNVFCIFLWFIRTFIYEDFSTFPTFYETTIKIKIDNSSLTYGTVAESKQGSYVQKYKEKLIKILNNYR